MHASNRGRRPAVAMSPHVPCRRATQAIAREYEFETELSAELAAFGASLALVTVPLWGTALELLT
jgi:hypothetical protein